MYHLGDTVSTLVHTSTSTQSMFAGRSGVKVLGKPLVLVFNLVVSLSLSLPDLIIRLAAIHANFSGTKKLA